MYSSVFWCPLSYYCFFFCLFWFLLHNHHQYPQRPRGSQEKRRNESFYSWLTAPGSPRMHNHCSSLERTKSTLFILIWQGPGPVTTKTAFFLPVCRRLLFLLLHAEKVPFPRATKEIGDVCTQATFFLPKFNRLQSFSAPAPRRKISPSSLGNQLKNAW